VVTIIGVADVEPLSIAAAVMVVIVAALHVYFLVLEMFLWRTPFGLRTFRMTKEAADSSAVLAANQGLYNGFLAAGLLWALVAYGVEDGWAILTFFLLSVIVAGIYGAATVSRRILFIQAVPAAIALVLVWLSR
jgi:putative membrane protein